MRVSVGYPVTVYDNQTVRLCLGQNSDNNNDGQRRKSDLYHSHTLKTRVYDYITRTNVLHKMSCY